MGKHNEKCMKAEINRPQIQVYYYKRNKKNQNMIFQIILHMCKKLAFWQRPADAD